eukprot:gnl/TRDRNA2_/TRDRNA2_54784_c0_seq2.p1 gnl/TRDRNA2_/TRDRNA2_54784_c0~~gnl/TRDRNA2_/TRDRNA2_54784_c0_seq2.p1  ORF type:complete len:228 (+),score=43.99 gnl/TRDRNA2_/TRDRNA2_54784_c0_seq2:79-762(+)
MLQPERAHVAVYRDIAHTVGLRAAHSIKNPVHLHRQSLRLDTDGRPRLSFVLDALEPCEVSVAEVGDAAGEAHRASLGAGMGQRFEANLDSCISASASRLEKGASLKLSIELRSTANESAGAEVTRIELRACAGSGDSAMEVAAVTQELQRKRGGKALDLLDVYGLGDAQGDGEDSELCSVCLSAPRDVVVLPCRHCCVCKSCASRMQRSEGRCPLCRQGATHLLQL